MRQEWHADPFAALEGLDHPGPAAQRQQAAAPGALPFDALYGTPAPAGQQQSSILGGLDSFAAPAAPAARQPDFMGDPFATQAPSSSLTGALLHHRQMTRPV